MKAEYRVIERMKWKKYAWIGLMALVGGGVMGQNPATSVRDSVPIVRPEPVSTDSLTQVVAADTVLLTPKQNAKIRKIVPKTATTRSAILPGLGQIHNGHWWKVPIIYAGFGTMIYFSSYYRAQSKLYRKYGIIANYSPGKSTQVPGYSRPIEVAQLERAARSAAKYRDYNYLGMGLLWGVNVIEANVTAHLKTFDISEDLTMKVKPTLLMPVISTIPVPGVQVAFRFKN